MSEPVPPLWACGEPGWLALERKPQWCVQLHGPCGRLHVFRYASTAQEAAALAEAELIPYKCYVEPTRMG